MRIHAGQLLGGAVRRAAYRLRGGDDRRDRGNQHEHHAVHLPDRWDSGPARAIAGAGARLELDFLDVLAAEAATLVVTLSLPYIVAARRRDFI